jgi:hypothetical protein
MMRNVVLLLCAALLPGAAACDEGMGVDDVLVSTGRSTYTRAASAALVDFFVLNQGRSDIAIAPCGETFVIWFERREGGGWAEVGGDVCPLSLAMERFRLDAGERAERDTRLEEEGLYRIRVDYQLPGGGTRHAYSNEFAVE